MLVYHQRSSVVFTWNQLHRMWAWIKSLTCVQKIHFLILGKFMSLLPLNGPLFVGWGHYWNFDPSQFFRLCGPKLWAATLLWGVLGVLIALTDCILTSNSHIFIGLSRSRDWSHDESHGPDNLILAAILENSHCEQPWHRFSGLLKFLCFKTFPNSVNCFLTIISLVWHAKDVAQIEIANEKIAFVSSYWSAIIWRFRFYLKSHHQIQHHNNPYFAH